MKILAIISFVLVINRSVHGFTDDEIALLKNLRVKCLEETGVPNDVVENVKNGVFDESEPLKCYMKCIWVTMTMMDEDGDIDEGVLEVLIPPDIKPVFAPVFQKCKGESGSNPCEKAFNLMKCMYKENPGSLHKCNKKSRENAVTDKHENQQDRETQHTNSS